ncbi:hypothetical protein SSX86_011645 [Deinandra increscens subsp. villosa]|uniref:CRIB domain-containing protein n=1 Tax=Deinandra increscens subsp. villosa TaxID=3103831 RepID=A0AAP0D309_9ASTR
MGTKVKGLIKGIKNISSQIFGSYISLNFFVYIHDEKEQEIQIGQPTDVKHVAHIGGDGPAVESPSWMRGFEASKESQSGPLDKTGTMVETPQVKCVSGDSTIRKARKDDSCHRSTRSVETSRELPLLPRSTKNRRRSMDNNMATETLSKDSSSSQSRHTRRHHRGSRRSQDQNTGDDTKTDIPKRPSRRIRKSKESLDDGPTRSFAKSTTDDSELGSDDV